MIASLIFSYAKLALRTELNLLMLSPFLVGFVLDLVTRQLVMPLLIALPTKLSLASGASQLTVLLTAFCIILTADFGAPADRGVYVDLCSVPELLVLVEHTPSHQLLDIVALVLCRAFAHWTLDFEYISVDHPGMEIAPNAG